MISLANSFGLSDFDLLGGVSGSYIIGMNQSYVEEQMGLYTNNTLDYLEANNLSNATLNDILGYRIIIKEELEILPNTLPYTVIERMEQYSEVPSDISHKLRFEIYQENYFGGVASSPDFSVTLSMPELAGKRITLSYVPASESDANLIEAYGGITSVPAYLVEMKPVLRVEGEAVATGEPVTLGETQQFTMEFQSPGGNIDRVENDVTVGAYYAVGLNLGKIPIRLVEEHKSNLATWTDLLGKQDVPLDSLVGELLYTTAITYFMELDAQNELAARSQGIVSTRHPSEAIVSTSTQVFYLFWAPHDFDITGTNIDVDRNIYSVFSKTGESSEAKHFMQASGTLSSSLEHGIFEQLYNVPSVSAVKVMQIANEQGIPVYTINSTNVNEILPKLQVSSAVKSGIQSAVATGKIVTIPERNIQYLNWTGTGYIVLDPETGAGAYMISGGLAGSSWALLLDCIKEIFNFVRSTLGGYFKQIFNFGKRLKDIFSSKVLTEEKLAAGTLALLVLIYGVIWVYAVGAAVGAGGIAALLSSEIIILTILFIIAAVILVILFNILINKTIPFESCEALVKRERISGG